jgi:thiamine biosynthesis lipoprotein
MRRKNFPTFIFKNKILFRYLFITLCFLLITLEGYAQSKRFVFSQPKMGSPFNIIFYSGDSTGANTTAQQCFQLVDSFVNIFSDYLDSSELNRLCARAGQTNNPVVVSPALFDILLRSKIAYEKSAGTFDITLGPLTKLWRKARKEKIFPGDMEVKEKLALTGFKKLIIDTATHGILLIQQGMQLDLGGIAQGYIAQQVIDFLKTKNIANALIDVSGDIVTIGAPPNSNGWTVGVNVPEKKDELLKQNLLISNKAVTTSGDVYQYIEHDGKRYSHIIDPQTGYGITSQKNVTVISGDGTTADWLTKACSILPVRKAKKLAHSLQSEVMIAEIKKGKLVFHTTKGFGRYWKK